MGTLDYHSFKVQNPDQIFGYAKWTHFTETIISEDDYENMRNVNDAFRDF